MKLSLIAAAAVTVFALTGCSTLNAQQNANDGPRASLPESCQIESILKAYSGFKAWDKTEPAQNGKQLNCMMGYPNSDVGFTIDFNFMTADAWATWRKKAITGNWVADTLTAEHLSTVYQITPNEGLGEGAEVKVFVHGVVMHYNLWSGNYDRNDPAILGAIAAIPVK